MMFLLAGAAVGYLYLTKKPATGVQPTAIAAKKPVGSAQPSNRYPFQAAQPPRVDNANQPWFNNNPAFKGAQSAIGSVAQDLQAGSSVVHSLSDIWGTLNLSSAFGSHDDGSVNLENVDNLGISEGNTATNPGYFQSETVSDASDSFDSMYDGSNDFGGGGYGTMDA